MYLEASPPHRLILLRCAFRPAPAEQKIPPEICHADFHACVKSERFASTKRPLLRNWPFQPRSGTLFWTLSSPSGCQNSSESSVFVAAWSNFVVLGAWHVGFVLLALSRKWPRRLGETHFSGLAGCALDSVLELSMEGSFGASRLKNSPSPSCRPRSHKIATSTSHLPPRTSHLPPCTRHLPPQHAVKVQ